MDYQDKSSRRSAEHDDWEQVHNDWLSVQAKPQTSKTPIVPKDDASEKEADTVAEKIVSGEAVDIGGMTGSNGGNRIHRAPGDGPGKSTDNKFDTFRITEADLSDDNIKARIDALGESGLIEYIDKTNDAAVHQHMMDVLVSKFPDLPTTADLVALQLITSVTERHTPFVFSTLQKLNKDQSRIDLLKTVYRHRIGRELETHLRTSLVKQDLDLALDLINIKTTPTTESLVNTAPPSTDDEYKALAHKLHAAMLPFPGISHVIFGVLIPFNHDAAKLQTLVDTYSKLYPGRKLGDDIAGHLKGENASYALYLLNAPPPDAPHANEINPNKPGDEKTDSITGGKISVHTDVGFQAGLQNAKQGFSIGYQGGLSSESRWMQFIWRELEVTTEIAGKDYISHWGGQVNTVAGTYFYQLDAAHPQQKLDAPSENVSTPFYEHYSRDNRTADGTTMFDSPVTSVGDVGERFDKGAKKVVSRAHFNTFLIRDYLAVYQVSLDVEWTFNEKPDRLPPRVNTVSKMTAVNGLPKPFKQALDGDKNYGKKFKYIR